MIDNPSDRSEARNYKTALKQDYAKLQKDYSELEKKYKALESELTSSPKYQELEWQTRKLNLASSLKSIGDKLHNLAIELSSSKSINPNQVAGLSLALAQVTKIISSILERLE